MMIYQSGPPVTAFAVGFDDSAQSIGRSTRTGLFRYFDLGHYRSKTSLARETRLHTIIAEICSDGKNFHSNI